MILYMPFFRSCTTLRSLTQLHARLLVAGLHRDPPASTKLIESYAQMGSLQSSSLVFQTFPNPDSFMWGVFIKCCIWNQFFEEAIFLYHSMIHKQVPLSSFIFPPLLRACSGFGNNSAVGGELHGRIIKCGFHDDPVTQTSLLCMFGEWGCLGDAQKVFDEMPVRDVVSWSSIISSYIENGEVLEGLEFFRLMVLEGIRPDSVTLLTVLDACTQLDSLSLARSVQGYIIRRMIESEGSLTNSLISVYSKCGDLGSAERIFLNITKQSTSSWTAMISGYNRSGYFHEALESFFNMLLADVEPNSVTMMSVIASCARLGYLREGKSLHCYTIRKEIDTEYDLTGKALIELYAECGKLEYCERVLHAYGKRDIVLRNMLISIYGQKGLTNEASSLFVQMQRQGLIPDSFTISIFLSACADNGLMWLGHQIHGHIIKTGLSDEFIQNVLIDMYAKCGCVELAYMIFDKLEQRSSVTWNSMICGFSQNGRSLEAINIFDQMYLSSLEMNEVTFSSVLQACSNLGCLEKGKWVHHKLIVRGVRKNLYIDTALTDMYAKCGDLLTAGRVFDSMTERSVVSWSSMISAYGHHGWINAALSVFSQMVESGIKPNQVTFMNILSACSHAGSLEEGKYYFNLMGDFGVEANLEHYVCMVDLLSRAGDLKEAYRIINSGPFPTDATIWAALLNGCRIHQRMDMIKTIGIDLLNIKTDDAGYYTLLSNIYAEEANWNQFGKVRSVLKGIGLRKVPGYSMIEIDKIVYRFGAGDTSLLQTKGTVRTKSKVCNDSLIMDEDNIISNYIMRPASPYNLYSDELQTAIQTY